MGFFKKYFTFNNAQRREFEQYLIHALESRAAWSVDEKKLTWPGLPNYKIIIFVDTDGLINVYAHFETLIKVKGNGTGNTIWVKGENRIYETFLSMFSPETITKLINNQLQPLN